MNLVHHILAHDNWLSYEQVMELALYNERDGYYSANISDIGFRGDFSTSASMGDLLARRIVSHWRESCDTFARRLPVIEIGGGNGTMALSIARALGFFGRLRARYYMVERSAELLKLQALAGGNFVRTFPDMESALKHAGGRAFIFCNELPDAFPARQFIHSGGEWKELGLSVVNGRITELARPCPHLPTSCVWEQWATEGQVVEVHESYRKWYTLWQPLWKAGTFVTIDYGDTNDRIYYRKPRGSLRGYKSHILLDKEQFTSMAGHCDITADVNFSDLLRLAQNYPEDAVSLISQRDYLLPLADMSSPCQRHLVDEVGAGSHFHVLIQQRFDI